MIGAKRQRANSQFAAGTFQEAAAILIAGRDIESFNVTRVRGCRDSDPPDDNNRLDVIDRRH